MSETEFNQPSQNVLRVLVVDDMADLADTTAALLMFNGYETRTAGSVAEARAQADFAPHVVVVDLGLPDGDGTELIGWAKSLPVPAAVVVVTGHTVPARLLAAERAGAAAVLLKPVDPRDLADHVRRACDDARPGEASDPA